MNESPAKESLPVIAGSGRSGTTWLLDVLAEANGLRPLFEPLYPNSSTVAEKYYCTYLDRSADAADLMDYLRRIVDRRERNSFVDYRIAPQNLKFSMKHLGSPRSFRSYLGVLRKLHRRRGQFGAALQRERVIAKFIRANWLLPWLVKNFSAKAVLVIRHPGAVVDSQLRSIDHWMPDARLNRYLESEKIRQSYKRQFDILGHRKLTLFEKLMVIWCIENVWPMQMSKRFGYTTVFYEHLKLDYPRNWSALTDDLGLDKIPARTAIIRPSQQSSSRWQGAATTRPGAWRDRQGAAEKTEFERILELFGVDFYDWSNDRPKVENHAGNAGVDSKREKDWLDQC